MTLASTVAGLATFALLFQTVVYLAFPSRLRSRWAPTTVGFFGLWVVIAAALIFGFETVGLSLHGLLEALALGFGTTVVFSIAAWVMARREDWLSTLADPRLGSMSNREARAQILVRIPFFTAFVEEAFFRGVLHAALMALYPADVALWLGAALFGVWHVGPGFDQAQACRRSPREGVIHTLVTVVAMTAAGAFLVWLRIETGSIWAPFAVHAAVNMTMAVWARYAARQSTSASVGPTVNL